MTPRAVAELLVAIGAVELRTDPAQWFTWTSGARAPIYCDNRVLMGFPAERARVADALAAAIRRSFPDAELIAGTATAGIAPAAWVAERLGLPMAYVRAQAKEHGRQKRVEGRPLRGERVVIVEDLISKGGSSADSVEGVRAEGGKVCGVQAIFSYGLEAAAQRFAALGVPYQSLSTYDALLEAVPMDDATRRVLLDWRGR
jgi:orotate phosphoribosyltransferase